MTLFKKRVECTKLDIYGFIFRNTWGGKHIGGVIHDTRRAH
jgi:hypothetical protein